MGQSSFRLQAFSSDSTGGGSQEGPGWMVGLGLKHGTLPGPNGPYAFVCVGSLVANLNTSMFEARKISQETVHTKFVICYVLLMYYRELSVF